jgi:hypothetical protein
MGTRFGAGIAQETRRVVETEHDRVQVLRELVRVEVFAKVPGGDASREDDSDHLEPALLERDEPVAHSARPVVELGRRSDEETAAPPGVRLRPGEPALEEGGDAGFPARLPHGGPHDLVDESLGGRVEDLDLEGFLGPEVREETALGKAEVGRETADGQASRPIRVKLDPTIEIAARVASPYAFANKSTNVRFMSRWLHARDADLLALAGKWRDVPVPVESTHTRVSRSTATIVPVAGRFLRFDYDWEYEGEP